MDQSAQPVDVDYTSDLIGNIRAHLAGLQGYDVMALELIQNADDAKAEEIAFDITDRGLLVRNSGRFTYCGDLNSRRCGFETDSYPSCDFHRIKKFGSGGKLSQRETIGRFGIGFVSTYQVTDRPEIRSSGIKLTLKPEIEKCSVESFNQSQDTSFFLPWADDPATEARLALGVSHVTASHIDQLTEDFKRVLRQSLLFLRHVRKAEVRRNGSLLLGCVLDRGRDSDVIVSLQPSDEVEQWHILRADATDAAKRLYVAHPKLESLQRSTKISIGLRTDPEPLAEGLLYAFLPTEQSTGLPLHINADFFPEADRKHVIFGGYQHEQAWNEMLIDAAAEEIARDPEGLLRMLGHVQLWQILGKAYDLSSQHSGHPTCYQRFWERIKTTAVEAQIVHSQDGTLQRPDGVFLPSSALNTSQVEALLDAGGRVVSEELRPFRTAMNQLGSPILTLERLVGLLESAMTTQVGGTTQFDETRLEHFYRPLWSVLDDLLPESSSPNPRANPTLKRLLALPFIVSEDLYAVTVDQSFAAPTAIDPGHIAALLPRLAIASQHILAFPRIARLIRTLDLGAVVSHLNSMCDSQPVEDVIGVDEKYIRELYSLLADLDRQSHVDDSVYQSLRSLPIWRSGRGLVHATQVLLPGNFTDPTGQANLLDTSVLTESAREFVSSKLGVQTQTIEAFVQTVLPTLFNDDGPFDSTKYSRLISELASHPELVNDDKIRRLLASLPIVPTQDGGWSSPTNTYRRSDDLVKVLGNADHLWLDASRLPNVRSVSAFLDGVGIRRSPLSRHLVDRILYIADNLLPTADAKRASSEAFYVLCEKYPEWKGKQAFENAISNLRQAACFPAESDLDNWYRADSLYAPYQAAAFRSQAHILDFPGNPNRLNSELLKDLGIKINPETRLVISHLRNCIREGIPPSDLTYSVLNDRAHKDRHLISSLASEQCIYVDSQKTFVRPNQLFWSPQQLGRYAFTIPRKFESFKPLFDAIGVTNAPAAKDFVEIFLDIVGEYFEQSKSLSGQDRAVYDICLASISSAYERDELSPADMRRVQEAPTILNLLGQLAHPDEVLLQDSEWHAGLFEGDLDQALCKPATELWSFLEKVGVRRLSESAQVDLEFVDGPEANEALLAEKLMDRIDIVTRLLNDKPRKVREKIRLALEDLKAVSHDAIRIQGSVDVGGEKAVARPASADAFYDINNNRLIIARPVSERSWSHVLNALFHQQMPEESGSEISKLTLSVRPLMAMSVEEAHRELSDAGIPYLDSNAEVGKTEDLTSPSLEDMGDATEPGAHEEGKPGALPTDDSGKGKATLVRKDGQQKSEASGPRTEAEKSERTAGRVSTGGERPSAGERHGSTTGADAGKGTAKNEHRTKKSRPQHKDQWDRRLLSYVRRRPTHAEADKHEGLSEHNLAVEVVARKAVCDYEKARGRAAEQMAQTHPGYDIISHDMLTGEDRLIEVKGINGEWNQTGVGLSRLQFSNAQEEGNRYWLYVVEFVSDPEHIRVHPIRSPAMQVTSFMFDGNWRDAVTEEPADPSLLFVPGVRIDHQDMGPGEIRDVVSRGSTKLLTILFDEKSQPTPNVTLNLRRMRILEDANGDNNS